MTMKKVFIAIVAAFAAGLLITAAHAEEVCVTKEVIVAAAPAEMVQKAGTVDDVALASAIAELVGTPDVIKSVTVSYLVVVLANDNGEFVVLFPLTAEGCGIGLDGKNAPSWETSAYLQMAPAKFQALMKHAAEFKDGI